MSDDVKAAEQGAPGDDELAALTTAREEAMEAVVALTVERDQLRAEVAALTKKHDKAAADLKAAKAKAAPKSAEARAIGPVPPPRGHKGDWSQPRGEDLLTLIGAADRVEIVFSDGAREITALPPQIISGPAWHLRGNGVKLRLPSLLIHGPARDGAAFDLAGYGLVLDGELTAWAPRIDILKIMPGGQYDLRDDVIFQ